MTEHITKQPQQSVMEHLLDWFARIAYGLVAVAVIVIIVSAARHMASRLPASDVAALIDRHGPALLGVPVALGVATILACIVRAFDGPLKLDVLGLKAEGAGAAALIWIAAFLAVALSIRALW